MQSVWGQHEKLTFSLSKDQKMCGRVVNAMLVLEIRFDATNLMEKCKKLCFLEFIMKWLVDMLLVGHK